MATTFAVVVPIESGLLEPFGTAYVRTLNVSFPTGAATLKVHVTLPPVIEQGEPLAPRLTSEKMNVLGAVPFTAVTISAIDCVFAEKYDAAACLMPDRSFVPAVTPSEIVMLAVPVGAPEALGVGVAVGFALAEAVGVDVGFALAGAVGDGKVGAGVRWAPPPPHPAPANATATEKTTKSERANALPRIFMVPG